MLLPFDPNQAYDQKGPAPVQAGNTSWLEADNGFQEECLNLNVWAPSEVGAAPLPVVVYIFGGGFEIGANTQTTSNAAGLAATGRVVAISLNYRLGPFGWLSLSQYGRALAEATKPRVARHHHRAGVGAGQRGLFRRRPGIGYRYRPQRRGV
ncbi:MAG: carboxylesterase family protein [Janthinobacterium lividum]